MIAYNKVRGTMESVINVEVNIDTVYIRSNVIAINTEDFKGWEYDEIQYGKDEYTELTNNEQIVLQEMSVNTIATIDMILIEILPSMMV